MRYEQNTAYDYNRIMNAAPKRRVEHKAKISRLPVKEHRKSQSRGLALKMVVAAIFAFMLCFNIYTQAEINNTEKEIKNAQSEISELDSEIKSLEMEMQNIVSYQNLEQEAEKLGMQKKSRSQIHYINISNEDKVEIIGKSN